MKYDFDQIIPRRHTNCVKWDEATEEHIIPLWVADMDFPTLPQITDALHRRIDHAIFGYTHVPQSYYHAVINWFANRHGLQGIQLPGDKVLIQTPVYNCFFSSIRNQGCVVEENRLVRHDNTYTIDWDDFERKCTDSRVRVFLLCNPHNPVGRVWTREELQRMGEICMKHDVFVIADEIHCELVMPGHTYTPFASVDETFQQNSATCVAPTKAFNIAGLQIANIIVNNPQKHERIDRAINLHEVCDVNPFGVIATEAAYTEEGAEWLRQLNDYLFHNYELLLTFFKEQLPLFPVTKLEGTYLVWVDCSVTKKKSTEIVDYLYHHHGVWLNDGEMYGEHGSFVRINIACQRSTLTEALNRMVQGLQHLI